MGLWRGLAGCRPNWLAGGAALWPARLKKWEFELLMGLIHQWLSSTCIVDVGRGWIMMIVMLLMETEIGPWASVSWAIFVHLFLEKHIVDGES